MTIVQHTPEVFQTTGGMVQVKAEQLDAVKAAAAASSKQRARLCLHPGSDDALHEMLIVLNRGTYIRPHRHATKCESFHIIEGELDIVLFRDDGTIHEVVRMGPYLSGKAFCYRLMEPRFHTVLVHTPYVLFHEITNGPFDATASEFAPWAPAEGDTTCEAYIAGLMR